jgi:hypothetical protein
MKAKNKLKKGETQVTGCCSLLKVKPDIENFLQDLVETEDDSSKSNGRGVSLPLLGKLQKLTPPKGNFYVQNVNCI